MSGKTSLKLLATLFVSLLATVFLASAISERSFVKVLFSVAALGASYGFWIKNRHSLPRKSFATASLFLSLFLLFAILGGVTSERYKGEVLWNKDPKAAISKAEKQVAADVGFLRQMIIRIAKEKQDVFTPLSTKDLDKLQTIASRVLVSELRVGAAQEKVSLSARFLVDANNERLVLQQAWDPKRESTWRDLIDKSSSALLSAESLINTDLSVDKGE